MTTRKKLPVKRKRVDEDLKIVSAPLHKNFWKMQNWKYNIQKIQNWP